MKIIPVPKLKLEKKMSLQNNDDDDDVDKRQNTFWGGSFDKQGVEFTFLSLLPVKWINKNKIR